MHSTSTTKPSFSPGCIPTAVGSLPHRNPQEAVDLLLRYLPDVPVWPQLPNCGYLESMYIQFSGGMPFLHLDSDKERMHMVLSRDIHGELELFYSHVLEDDLDYFSIQPGYARGFNAFMDRLWRNKLESVRFVKGQVTGPISFGLMITDEHKRAVLYNEEVFDAVVKSLALKTRWQIRKLQRLCPEVIIFIDEPYLSSFGSAFINLTREQVLQYLGEVIDAVHRESALAGVHCCGNTDWSILMQTPVDIINFDAYEYFQGMTLYAHQLKTFLTNGGMLAWGIIPTSPQIDQEDDDRLTGSFLDKVSELDNRGVPGDLVFRQSLLTPSCGMGTLKEDQAERVLRLLSTVSAEVRSSLATAKKRKAG